MKTKAFITLLAVAIILGGAIGGALVGGIAIGKSQGREEARQGLQSQMGRYSSSQGNATQLPGASPGIPSGSRATMGTVEKVEGIIVTLNTGNGTVIIHIGTSTSIQKTVEGSLEDISSGVNIAVSGDKNEDGSIEAKNISITSGFTFFGRGGQSQ